MNARLLLLLVLLSSLIGGLFWAQQALTPPSPSQAFRRAQAVSGFPPRPRLPRSSPEARPPAPWSWLDSGNVVPADYPRRDFEQAPDLHRLALAVVGQAAQGSAVHAYLLYLALDECRIFLRLDAQSILPLYDRMLGIGTELSPHEQLQWAEQFNRCVGFAVYDWQPIGEALGQDRPRVNVEYAGAWFVRAVAAGHPPALVEKAFRPGELTSAQRQALVRRALGSDDPEVYWLLFLQAYDREQSAATALPWLRLGCESGMDCRFHAPWFQLRFCVQQACSSAPSALAWFWQQLSSADRATADEIYQEMSAALATGRIDDLPLPATLATRFDDSARRRLGEDPR